MDDESGESMEPTEEVPLKELGESEYWKGQGSSGLKPVNHTRVCVVRQWMHVGCTDYPAAEVLPDNNVTII